MILWNEFDEDSTRECVVHQVHNVTPCGSTTLYGDFLHSPSTEWLLNASGYSRTIWAFSRATSDFSILIWAVRNTKVWAIGQVVRWREKSSLSHHAILKYKNSILFLIKELLGISRLFIYENRYFKKISESKIFE